MNASNLVIEPFAAEKRVEDDHYETGCDPDSSQTELITLADSYPNIVEAFRSLVGDRNIGFNDIRTFDPNIYRDAPDGGALTVVDNERLGNFRCIYDRMENARGNPPTAEEKAEFEAGKISLKHADYEIHFTVRVIALDETQLAAFLGVQPGL